MSHALPDALATRDALADASVLVTPRAIRYELARRAREWRHVCSLLEHAHDDDVVIELAGAVVPGMEVVISTGFGTIERVMQRDGQLTIHVTDDSGFPIYLNLHGRTSPVLVKA